MQRGRNQKQNKFSSPLWSPLFAGALERAASNFTSMPRLPLRLRKALPPPLPPTLRVRADDRRRAQKRQRSRRGPAGLPGPRPSRGIPGNPAPTFAPAHPSDALFTRLAASPCPFEPPPSGGLPGELVTAQARQHIRARVSYLRQPNSKVQEISRRGRVP